MRKQIWIGLFLLSACAIKRQEGIIRVDQQDVQRIISTLADDQLKGRALFTKELDEAADFIGGEFAKAGLKPLEQSGTSGFLQQFEVVQIKPAGSQIVLDGAPVSEDHAFVVSDQTALHWDKPQDVVLERIRPGDDFRQKYQAISTSGKNTWVSVDPSFEKEFLALKQYLGGSRVVTDSLKMKKTSSVYALTKKDPTSFRVDHVNILEKKRLANVVGMLPGKSKPDEYVIFSGHYDHLGILKADGQDSIANGADDDASGVTAVISLAKIYGRMGNNERTLIFTAFTGEESGGFGSQYFSKQLDPAKVMAMINIEMIGKDSKFGPQSMYITGFDKSNLGNILQENVKNSGFSFYPDPYPEQNLFYRSDNATLAALGVPAHSFSTVQIDRDSYYHTVHDELKTLDIQNIVSSIHAIALGARSIVEGKDTPSRVQPLKP